MINFCKELNRLLVYKNKIDKMSRDLNENLVQIESINRQIISNLNKVYYLSLREKSDNKEREILNRIDYFLPNCDVQIIRKYNLLPRHIRLPLLIESNVDMDLLNRDHATYYFGSYNIDYENNPFEGWEWHRLLTELNKDFVHELIQIGKKTFLDFITKIKKNRKNKVYIFGTGPSLYKAIKRDFSDGYVIVCNTIVKDKLLFRHLKPDFIIATDAIFHFDNNRYAEKFRNDLNTRFFENKNFLFLFDSNFLPIATRYFYDYKNQLIGIPKQSGLYFNDDLTKKYFLTNMGNVLTFALLPLAATLAKDILLWGFDGKSPIDKLFWNHSQKHNYESDIKSIIKKHPAFFEYQIPKSNPNKYIKENLTSSLEIVLSKYESRGYRITMMHPSYTKPLAERFKNSI